MSQAEQTFHVPASVWVAGLGMLGAAITGVITFFSGRNASVAVLQTALVSGFKELNDQQMQKIADLQEEVTLMRGEIQNLRSELAAEGQRTISLKNLLRANGIDIPRETVAAVVFTPYPDSVEDLDAQQGSL